jgi:hypothetical protein
MGAMQGLMCKRLLLNHGFVERIPPSQFPCIFLRRDSKNISKFAHNIVEQLVVLQVVALGKQIERDISVCCWGGDGTMCL